jgi:hypothetical protein
MKLIHEIKNLLLRYLHVQSLTERLLICVNQRKNKDFSLSIGHKKVYYPYHLLIIFLHMIIYLNNLSLYII